MAKSKQSRSNVIPLPPAPESDSPRDLSDRLSDIHTRILNEISALQCAMQVLHHGDYDSDEDAVCARILLRDTIRRLHAANDQLDSEATHLGHTAVMSEPAADETMAALIRRQRRAERMEVARE